MVNLIAMGMGYSELCVASGHHGTQLGVSRSSMAGSAWCAGYWRELSWSAFWYCRHMVRPRVMEHSRGELGGGEVS